MIMGRKTDGLSLLSRMFVSGSNTEYEIKKMVRVEL